MKWLIETSLEQEKFKNQGKMNKKGFLLKGLIETGLDQEKFKNSLKCDQIFSKQVWVAKGKKGEKIQYFVSKKPKSFKGKLPSL